MTRSKPGSYSRLVGIDEAGTLTRLKALRRGGAHWHCAQSRPQYLDGAADRIDYAAEFDHNGIAGVCFTPFCNARGRIDQIAAQRAQPCWGAVVGGARAVLRFISWTRRGNGLDQTLAETKIEQLDVRIDGEL